MIIHINHVVNQRSYSTRHCTVNIKENGTIKTIEKKKIQRLKCFPSSEKYIENELEN
jgi:hypothetical protein